MKYADAFQFIKDVAVDWRKSKYLFAEPGDYLIVARQAKDSGQWFVGGVTDELSRSFEVPMSFLDAGNNGSWRRICNVRKEDVKIHRCARACP